MRFKQKHLTGIYVNDDIGRIKILMWAWIGDYGTSRNGYYH